MTYFDEKDTKRGKMTKLKNEIEAGSKNTLLPCTICNNVPCINEIEAEQWGQSKQ